MSPEILLVDDERDFVQTLGERLGSRGFETRLAYSGEEALAAFVARAPLVVVLDLKMPGLDGLEVLRRIRSDHPKTRVVMLSAHGSDRERALAATLGVYSWLRKPVDVEVLADTLRRALRAADGAPPPAEDDPSRET